MASDAATPPTGTARYSSLAASSLVAVAVSVAVAALATRLPGAQELIEWSPSRTELWNHLHPVTPPMPDYREYVSEEDLQYVDAEAFTRWSSRHWWMPKVLCVVYLASIYFGKKAMERREPIYATQIVTAWNLFLSCFSLCGLSATLPKLIQIVQQHGFTGSFCATPWEYGFGSSGFWVAAFIFSKPVEMVDTAWLVLRRRPVIFLHWYHHTTVMLFCWHSYASRIGSAGLWFATMNYFVHSIMYLYFALTLHGSFLASKPFQKFLKRWVSPVVTSLQITQMVMGLVVLVAGTWRAVQFPGTCEYLPKITAILGLGMYASYFVLFAQLFVNHYILGNR